MAIQRESDFKLYRRGRRLQYATIAWNMMEVFVTIGLGLAAGSLALIAFGLDSLVEVFASGTVLWYIADHDAGGRSRRALKLVAAAFALLAVVPHCCEYLQPLCRRNGCLISARDHVPRNHSRRDVRTRSAQAEHGSRFGKRAARSGGLDDLPRWLPGNRHSRRGHAQRAGGSLVGRSCRCRSRRDLLRPRGHRQLARSTCGTAPAEPSVTHNDRSRIPSGRPRSTRTARPNTSATWLD